MQHCSIYKPRNFGKFRNLLYSSIKSSGASYKFSKCDYMKKQIPKILETQKNR